MANPNNPFGFRIARHRGGGCVQHTDFTLADSLAASLFTGDPIKATGVGKNVTVAEADSAVAVGVFLGCEYTEADGGHRFAQFWLTGTTGTEIEVQAAGDSKTSFFIQTDTLTADEIGKKCDWDDGAGSAQFGTSGRILLASAVTPTTGAVKILGLADLPGNEYGDHAIAEVQFVVSEMM